MAQFVYMPAVRNAGTAVLPAGCYAHAHIPAPDGIASVPFSEGGVLQEVRDSYRLNTVTCAPVGNYPVMAWSLAM